MAKKNFGKRILAILMSLVLLVGLIPLNTLAAQSAQDQVMDGHYVLNQDGSVQTTTNSSSNTANGFTVSKDIEWKSENNFEITLEVQTSQTVITSAAAVQLVIDRSNSMKWCASCGDDNCRCNAGTRLSAVKNAIAGTNGFLDSLVKNNKGTLYLSVVTFGTYAQTEIEWTDISNAEGLAAVKNAVNGITANGGTNLEAGLMLARNRLKMDAIASCSSKYTVLLSDGAPTYYVDGNDNSTEAVTNNKGNGSDTSANTVSGGLEMATAVKELSTLYTICYGVSDEALYVTEKTVCRNCGKTHDEHNAVEETTTSYILGFIPITNTETVYYCSGTSGSVWRQGQSISNEVTVGDYLSDQIATSASHSYNADDTAGVNAAFSAVSTSAVSGMTGAGTTVTDPMGQFIVLGDVSQIRDVTAANNQLTWSLDKDSLVNTEVNGNTTTYTYRMKYPITLDTAAVGFQEDHYYPANGYTYLSVVTDNGTVQVPFHVPGVKGKLPMIDYKVQYYLQGDAAADDFAAYQLDEEVTMDAVKAWSTVGAPSGYADKYADNYYAFRAMAPQSLQVVPGGDNVIRLYYNRVGAQVTVNHYYKTDYVHPVNGTTVGEYTLGKTEQASANAGDSFTATESTQYNGVTFTRLTPNDQMVIAAVSATGENVINVYYTRTVNTYGYSVIYDGNGGALQSGDSTYGDSENVTSTENTSHQVFVDANSFTHEHYQFIGWNTKADGSGKSFAAGETITLTAENPTAVLYAQWKEDAKYDYSVTYHGNGGTVSGISQISDSENLSGSYKTAYAIHVDANTFALANYTFIGWALTPDGDVAYTAEEVGTAIQFVEGGHLDLYAKWQENPKYDYTLTYNANFGETPATFADEDNKSGVYETSCNIGVNNLMFSHPNYTFTGWNTMADGSGKSFQPGETVTLTVTEPTAVLYAQWTENPKFDYAVSYNANFGETPETADDEQNVTGTYRTSYTIEVNSNPFSRANYTFIGWALTPDGSVAYQAGDEISFVRSGHITLYAKWIEHDKYSYTVIYNGNGGTLSDNASSYGDLENVESTYAVTHTVSVDANTFLRDNYTFIGWNDMADGSGKSYTADEAIALTAQDNTKTLYAQWVENPKFDYSVIYNANFGETPATRFDSENVTGIYAATYSIEVDANSFERTGYTFAGWNDKADGSGKSYTADEVIVLTAEDNTRTLYAQWTKNSYSYTVIYLVSVGDSEYIVFTGTLPADAPTGGEAPYGTVLDSSFLTVPEALEDDAYLYSYATMEGTTVSDGENVVYVYYAAEELEEIPEETVPEEDIPDDPIPLAPAPVDPQPQTGDPILFFAGSAVLSGIGLVTVVLKKKKEDAQ